MIRNNSRSSVRPATRRALSTADLRATTGGNWFNVKLPTLTAPTVKGETGGGAYIDNKLKGDIDLKEATEIAQQ